ncbi:MAG TPA: hypothetical protein VMF30_01910 [Pirellulales bacterium]|nr:hypothetical protein [Pirellulales bacterium]
MSTFERDNFQWRETYFVLFDTVKRPSLSRVEKALKGLNSRFRLTAGVADDDGHFESLTLLSPDDYAALDISYVSGDEVREQGESLYQELKSSVADEHERAQLARLPKCDARFDLFHFEELTAGTGGDDPDEMLDPSALLVVLEALARLTKGVGVDPQSGTLL